jgi:hypothetical protein
MPLDNYTGLFYHEAPGLYVTDSVEYWWNAYGYYRPFVAEIECPANMEQFKTRGHEWRIPATEFSKCRLLRVIPTEEWFGEQYGETYISDEPRPKGYRYQGDVRELPLEQTRAMAKTTRDWMRQYRNYDHTH